MFIYEYPTSEEDFNIADDVSIAEMVLGNSDLTQMLLEVPDEPVEEKKFPENLIDRVNELKESILNGTFSDYVVRSYVELSDNDKLIINALIVVILLSIVIKIVKMFMRKKDVDLDYELDIDEEILEITNVEELQPKEKKITSVPKKEEDEVVSDDIEDDEFSIKMEDGIEPKDDFDIEENH